MESNDIKDYLHLYLGCGCVNKATKGITEDYYSTVQWSDIGYPNDVKALILRPLSDMTEEEAEAIAIIMFGQPDSVKWRLENKGNYLDVSRRHYHISFTIDVASGDVDIYDGGEIQTTVNHHFITKYMLSRGFDLFNLIEKGLALDKTKLKETSK